MVKKHIFLIMCFIVRSIYTEQFIYPVAEFADGNHLMLVYQKSLHDVELWIWDTVNHCAMKGLSSFVTPANLRMMPSGKGFSFIDQGYIKIKEFIKRSPITLPIYEPIGLFSSMNWIDDENFYFVARQGDFFQIFKGNLDGEIQALTYNAADALYPHIINLNIFYIERDSYNHNSIVCQTWNVNMQKYEIAYIIKQKESSEQLCFLHMLSEQEGFYLQAPKQKARALHDTYEFTCYHFCYDHDQWKTKKLFHFKIPVKYINGADRLYESIEPFLPNYTCKNYIYFVDWQQNSEKFKVSKFSMLDSSIENISDQITYRNNQNQLVFVPYIYQETIYCGLILQENRVFEKNFETEHVYFELPTLVLKNKC